MPMFAYKVRDALGNAKHDIVESLNEQVLVEKLQSEGYFAIIVKPALSDRPDARPKTTSAQKFTHNKAKLDDLLVVARQLATLLESGVTLMRSLAVITEQIDSKELHRVLTQVRAHVEQGKTLSSSLSLHPKIFNQFWISLVEVGEASGTMPMVLEKLAVYCEQEAAFRSTVTSALIYPGVLFIVVMGAVAFFALFVAPRFEGVFASLGNELPALTKFLLALFKFVKTNILLLIAGAIGLFYVMKAYFATKHGKLVFEKVMFKMPVFAEVYKLIIVERFASQMSVLVDSGVPILYALEISERLVENITCSLIIAKIRENVREGKLLAEPMEESAFFPPMCVQMIKVGEETGELGKMLQHVAAFYQRSVAAFMKRFGTLIEPVMLVFMGAIIGTIVIAMFLPIFSLTG